MKHLIRPVQADEWAKVKELRLLALRDPVADIAFLETYEEALKHSDSFWQERASGVNRKYGIRAQQFIAETSDGTWAGTVTVMIEETGTVDFFQTVVEQSQGHVVGVFVRPEHRGAGLIQELIGGALEWVWSDEETRVERVRLFVHENNARATKAYRKAGFEPTGLIVPFAPDPATKELELAVRRP